MAEEIMPLPSTSAPASSLQPGNRESSAASARAGLRTDLFVICVYVLLTGALVAELALIAGLN